MNEDELFALIRENYNGANEDYLKKQVKEALKIPLLSKEETLDGLLNLVVVAGCCGLNEHYQKYLFSAIGHLQANDKYIKLDDVISAMQKLYQDDIESYGVEIPETFDAERAIEALKQLT